MYGDYFTDVHNVRSWRNWQTRTVQVRVVAISWRFESSRPHQLTMKELLNFLIGRFRSFLRIWYALSDTKRLEQDSDLVPAFVVEINSLS
jgi:hypothetical protein